MTSHENNEAGDVRDEGAETPPPVDRLTRNAPIGGGANAQPSAFPPATTDALLDEVDTLRDQLRDMEIERNMLRITVRELTDSLEAGDACGAVGCRAMGRLSEVIDEAADDLLVRATAAEERLTKVEALADEWIATDGEPVSNQGLAVLSTVNRLGRELSAALSASDGPGLLAEIDRNARAYGWEVGHGHPLAERIDSIDPANPFLVTDWRAALSTERGEGK